MDEKLKIKLEEAADIMGVAQGDMMRMVLEAGLDVVKEQSFTVIWPIKFYPAGRADLMGGKGGMGYQDVTGRRDASVLLNDADGEVGR